MSEHSLECGNCGHRHPVEDAPEQSIYKCSECGFRTAFGTTLVRTTINPHSDHRFRAVTFAFPKKFVGPLREVSVVFDRDYAAEVALELLSVCSPGKYKAILSALGSARDIPGIPKPEDDRIEVLDEPFRDPGPGKCACGEDSFFANGACRACVDRLVR